MAKSNFIVRGGADFSGIQKEISKTEKNLKGFENRINSMFSGISQGLGINLGKLTKVGLIAAATKKLVDFGKASIDVAADMREVQNVVDVTFGSMAKDVDDFAANSVKAYGLSTLAAKRHASTMGAMLKSSGIAGEAVRDMALDLTALAADMASFYNLDNDVAFQKIMSGMSGMTQPLKELGINMNIANVEAFALSQGFNKAWREMSQAEQTMWRYNYLLHVTKDAQGDFAREIGTWSNQVKILKMQWEEFMSLIGKALVEILLPVVRFLNKALELLIKIAKAIGKIYSMITGKEVAVETNVDISDSASEAAESELDLADGIGKAAKAAKKALAPFDELNILQQNLASGGGTGSSLFDGLNNVNQGKLDTALSTEQVDNSLEESKRKWEGFFIWLDDWWNRLKQTFSVPIHVPAPIFASIPSPIYNPDWGLEIPKIPAPIFPPIPAPVYDVEWGLEPPTIPEPEFPSIPKPVYEPVWNLDPPPVPAVNYKEYAKSLETMRTDTVKLYKDVEKETEALRNRKAELWGDIGKEIETETGRISKGLVTSWNTIEGNYKTHESNMGKITSGISDTVVKNTNEGLSKLGKNTNNTILTTQDNWQVWGRNLGDISAETGRVFNSNLNEFYKAGNQNIISFANAQIEATAEMGNGMVKASAETVKAMNDNYNSGFSSIFESFVNLRRAIGEKISGFFKKHGKLVLKTGLAIGATALAVKLAPLAVPAAIKYGGAALGALKAIPALALAEGGITNGPTLALIGDNPGGREVVSPLDDLLGMIEAVVSETGASGGDIHLTIKIGEDTITEKVISNINRQNRIAGTTVIQV